MFIYLNFDHLNETLKLDPRINICEEYVFDQFNILLASLKEIRETELLFNWKYDGSMEEF